jgi:hypothetical protein
VCVCVYVCVCVCVCVCVYVCVRVCVCVCDESLHYRHTETHLQAALAAVQVSEESYHLPSLQVPKILLYQYYSTCFTSTKALAVLVLKLWLY